MSNHDRSNHDRRIMSENPGVYIAMKSAVLVTTKGYRVLVTTIESQNAFAPSLRFAYVSRDSQNTHDQITSDRKSKFNHTRDQIVNCAFHSFLVEVQTNAGYVHVTYA